MTIDVGALTAQEQVTAIYIAYYDRAPDPFGLEFWTVKLTSGELTIAEIANFFADAAETKLKYAYFEAPSLAGAADFINEIYQNLFGRAPDAEGAAFWIEQLESGAVAPGEFILAVLAGAQDIDGGTQDKSTIENKIVVAYDWTLDALDEGIGTSQNPFALEVDGIFTVINANVFSEATSILDGVTGDPASVTDALAQTDAFFGGALGETLNLEVGQDTIVINTIGTVDTVRGLLDNDGVNDNSTFDSGDFIEGNGLTELRLTLADAAGGVDFVEMSGVNAIEFRGAGAGAVTFDASSYGTDLNEFLLSGADGTNVVVDNVEFDEGALTFVIAEGTEGSLDVSGESGPFTSFTVDMDTTGQQGAYLIADIGNNGIEAVAGEDANVELFVGIDITETSGDATIGSVNIGDVNLVALTDAFVSVTISLSASANVSGDATVGDLTVGDVSLAAGLNGTASLSLYQSASADEGNATVGNLTVGDVVMNVGEAGFAYLYLSQSASASTGDATVGNTTVGDITATVGDDASASVSIYQFADVTEGNATVGDITVGNIVMTGGDSATVSFYASHTASASTGDATVGNITIGDVSMAVGDDGSIEFDASQTASVSEGNATVGNITIGDVVLSAGVDGDIEFSVTASAFADTGDAIVGNITLGDITLTMGSGASADISVSAEATVSNSGNAIIGNITVGDISAELAIDADLGISISATATGTGTMTAIGDVTVGDLTFFGEVALGADVDFNVSLDSDGSIGAVTIGDVNVDLQSDSSFSYDISIDAGTASDGAIGAVLLGNVNVVADDIYYEVSASGDMTAGVTIGDITLSGDDIEFSGINLFAFADIGDVTIGNIMLDAATNLDIVGIDISATGDVGDVEVGNISINFIEFETFTVDIVAGDDLGDVSVGDIAITVDAGTADIGGFVNVSVSGAQDVGDVSVGDISISVEGSASFYASATVDLDFDAGAGDDLGDVTVGDISLVVSAEGVDVGSSVTFATVSATIGGVADTVGDVVFGDIDIQATAANVYAAEDGDNDAARGGVYIRADQGSVVTSLTIGDIDFTLTNSVDDSTAFTAADVYNSAVATLSVTSDASITVGDINLSAVNAGTVDLDANGGGVLFDFNVTLSADAGGADITIGDISVSGGGTLDNLGSLTAWLTTNGATVTVGDIDYSGYAGDAAIDVSGLEGAVNILAGSGDTNITVNATQNLITLGDGADVVFYEAVEDAGTTYADIDKISDFVSADDVIDFSFFGLTNVDVAGVVASYDAFLVAAAAAFDFDGALDVFAMNDGSNTYVAVNTDGDDAIEFAIELTGVTNVVEANFVV